MRSLKLSINNGDSFKNTTASEVAIRGLYTDCLIMLRGGMNAFTQKLHFNTVLWYWDGLEQA